MNDDDEVPTEVVAPATGKEIPTNESQVPPACETKSPNYLFSIDCFSDDVEIIAACRSTCCHTCGDPFFRLGELCPECKKKLRERSTAFGQSLADLFSGRLVHMHGIGYVDPWTRSGRDLIGDG